MPRIETWRLVINEGDVYWCMALDEAILEARLRNLVPNTLRLYVINPSAVTVGYFQKISDAINLEYLTKHSIPFTRRITGGGSVYHDANGEITYSLIADTNFLPRDIQKCYEFICQSLIEALSLLHVKAVFMPVNDIVANGRKISGSAQIRRGNVVLQHGTLMYNTDLNVLARALKVPIQKLASHGISSIKDRVTTVSLEVGKRVLKSEVVKALIEGFKKVLKVEFEKSEPTSEEVSLARQLAMKYKSRDWIFKR